jgi:hypothetical protein
VGPLRLFRGRAALALAALLAVAALPPAMAQSRTPAAATPAAADSVAATPPAPRTPEERVLARIRAAVADSAGLAPTGPFPPLDAPLAGVVWQQPASVAEALLDLLAMRRAGVRAVRTDLVADERVLDAASRLGLALYQDLPVQALPAAFLVRAGDEAEALLAEALDRARPYPAARHFGLARASDTSDPAARPYFERLTALARQRGAPGTQTYYVTRFPRADRAARTVDLVLLDARDADPVALLALWRGRHPTPAGIAALGVGVVPGREGGWRMVGSEAAQARALENALNDLLNAESPPAVAFVHRWRDLADAADDRDQRANVTGTLYGLLQEDGTARPAFAVARGFFTGTQRVFAVDAGAPSGEVRRASPLLLMGWVLVLALGLFYATAPKLSALAPRYFGRRDLYREAVQRGYDLSTFETSGLALGLVLVVGVVLASVLRAFGRTDALAAATSAWSPEAQLRVADLVGRPFTLVLVLALGYAAWLLLNLIWLNILTGRRRLRPAQALSLAVWSRWAWLPLMAFALLLGGISPRMATVFAPVVLGLALLIETAGSYRMLLDFGYVTNNSMLRSLVVGFLLPFLLALAGLLTVAALSGAEASFLWHLATRS